MYPQNINVYDYQRVIPRDLFNEAKLLKCLGFIALHIHEGNLFGMRLTVVEDGEAFTDGYCKSFDIKQSDEGLYAANLIFTTRNSNEVFFVHPYNSKDNFPLQFANDSEEYFRVFQEDGEYSVEFLLFITEGVTDKRTTT